MAEGLSFNVPREVRPKDVALVLEFRNRRSGIRTNTWTLYRIYFTDNEVLRLARVLQDLAMEPVTGQVIVKSGEWIDDELTEKLKLAVSKIEPEELDNL